MRRTVSIVPAIGLWLSSFAVAQRGAETPSIDLVEIDVAVVGDHDQPITGLTQKDFTIKEDGSEVEIKNYYMLGYWPSGKSRELHSIDVKVARRGAKVRARHRRGN